MRVHRTTEKKEDYIVRESLGLGEVAVATNLKRLICITTVTKEEYQTYLKSPHWLLVKKHFYEKNKKECKVCGSHLHLNIHHKTYVHFGMEMERDLICLCENCHNAAHKLNLTELNDGQLNKLKKIKVSLKWSVPSWKKKKWKYKGKQKYNERPKKKNKLYSSAKCPPVNKFTKEQVEEYKKRMMAL